MHRKWPVFTRGAVWAGVVGGLLLGLAALEIATGNQSLRRVDDGGEPTPEPETTVITQDSGAVPADESIEPTDVAQPMPLPAYGTLIVPTPSAADTASGHGAAGTSGYPTPAAGLPSGPGLGIPTKSPSP